MYRPSKTKVFMRFVPTILVAVTVIPLVATAVAETQPAAATTHPHIAPDPRGGWITDKEAILVPDTRPKALMARHCLWRNLRTDRPGSRGRKSSVRQFE